MFKLDSEKAEEPEIKLPTFAESSNKQENSRKTFISASLTMLFRYDLNQFPYDYTLEMTNRFKGLDLIECLKNYGQKSVTLHQRQ